PEHILSATRLGSCRWVSGCSPFSSPLTPFENQRLCCQELPHVHPCATLGPIAPAAHLPPGSLAHTPTNRSRRTSSAHHPSHARPSEPSAPKPVMVRQNKATGYQPCDVPPRSATASFSFKSASVAHVCVPAMATPRVVNQKRAMLVRENFSVMISTCSLSAAIERSTKSSPRPAVTGFTNAFA